MLWSLAVSVLPAFANEPVLELRRATVRAELGDALAAVDAGLPVSVPVIVGPDSRASTELPSTDPGDPDRVVAQAASAREDEVAAAVSVAAEGFRAWAQTPDSARADALVRAAAWMRERRLALAALEVRECAKPWPEADSDVCEAIDFLEYYARGAVALAQGRRLLQVPGEHNELRYVARGVTAVISPWNFPLAIPCGMTAAALATGNPVVLKPAEQSPGCAHALVQALRAGGVPPAAISLLPGEGDVGAALVAHPEITTIAFTGSLPVGLEIVRAAAQPAEGQAHIKRVIAELGGKNCILVDADADLDEAVPAIVSSAFVYAGQKCSAAARVLVHEAIADELIERVTGSVRTLIVGQADELGTDVPPVIERAAQERVLRIRALAARDGRVVVGGARCRAGLVLPAHGGGRVARRFARGAGRDLRPAADDRADPAVEEGCDVIDSLPYALTGGLFSRDPQTVRYVPAHPRRQPLRQPRDHRRHGRTSAVRGQPAIGHRQKAGVPITCSVRRATGGDRKHDAPRNFP